MNRRRNNRPGNHCMGKSCGVMETGRPDKVWVKTPVLAFAEANV